MNQWEAERAMIAARVAATSLYLQHKHDILRQGKTLQEFIEAHVRQSIGWDYLGYRALIQPVSNYLNVIAEERGFDNLQQYWNAKIEGYM